MLLSPLGWLMLVASAAPDTAAAAVSPATSATTWAGVATVDLGAVGPVRTTRIGVEHGVGAWLLGVDLACGPYAATSTELVGPAVDARLRAGWRIVETPRVAVTLGPLMGVDAHVDTVELAGVRVGAGARVDVRLTPHAALVVDTELADLAYRPGPSGSALLLSVLTAPSLGVRVAL